MANIYNVIGAVSTVGGLLSNALKKKNGGKPGKHAEWAKLVPQHIKDYGVQRDNLGLVFCPVPKVMKDRYGNNNDRIYGITRRSESFNVPGPSIPVSEVRRYGVGPNVKVPVGTINSTNFTMNLLADQMGLYYQWIAAWMDGIVNFNGRSKRAMITPNEWGAHFYEVSYFKDYAVDLTLIEMDETYDTIIETTLVGAYPVAMSDKQINWGNSGLVTFNVEFAYTASDVKIDKVKPPGALPPPPKGPSQSAMGTILKGLSIVQTLSSMRGRGGAANAVGLVAAGAAAINVVGGLRR